MLMRFVDFIMHDGFYWISMLVALIAVYMSDNRLKSTIYAATFGGDYELIYFDI